MPYLPRHKINNNSRGHFFPQAASVAGGCRSQHEPNSWSHQDQKGLGWPSIFLGDTILKLTIISFDIVVLWELLCHISNRTSLFKSSLICLMLKIYPHESIRARKPVIPGRAGGGGGGRPLPPFDRMEDWRFLEAEARQAAPPPPRLVRSWHTANKRMTRKSCLPSTGKTLIDKSRSPSTVQDFITGLWVSHERRVINMGNCVVWGQHLNDRNSTDVFCSNSILCCI